MNQRKNANWHKILIIMLINVPFFLLATNGAHSAYTCKQCHGTHSLNGFGVPRDDIQANLCNTCHNPLGDAPTLTDKKMHVVSGGSQTVDCGSCHDTHGIDIVSTNPNDGVTQENLSLIRNNPLKYLPNAADVAVFQTRDQFAFQTGEWVGICQTCHTNTAHHTNDASADHDHFMTMSCVDCHKHKNGFSSEGGCTICHSEVQGPRRQIVGPGGDFDKASAHFPGVITDDECTLCHDTSQHKNGTVRMKNPDTGGYPGWTGEEAVFCLTCHDNAPPAGVSFPAAQGTGYDKTRFTGSTHATQLNQQSCMYCHTAHGSSYASLLKGTYYTGDYTRYRLNNFTLCWECHDEDEVINQDNAFRNRHKKHVKGEDSACIYCHDVHGPFDSGEPGLIDLEWSNNHLNDFNFDGNTHTFAFQISGSTGYCYLDCHGETHSPEDYPRVSNNNITQKKECIDCH